jgi:hypothetical protein
VLGTRHVVGLRDCPQVPVKIGTRGDGPRSARTRLARVLKSRKMASSRRSATILRPRLRLRLPRRWRGRFADGLFEHESLRAWNSDSHHRPRHSAGRYWQCAWLPYRVHCDALLTTGDTFHCGTGRTPVLAQQRIAYGARRMSAAACAGADVRGGEMERLDDPGQATPSREHRDENHDDQPQLRNERSHATAAPQACGLSACRASRDGEKTRSGWPSCRFSRASGGELPASPAKR